MSQYLNALKGETAWIRRPQIRFVVSTRWIMWMLFSMYCTVPIKWFVSQYLKDANIVNDNTVTKPNEVQQEDLLLAHTARYLKSLKVNKVDLCDSCAPKSHRGTQHFCFSFVFFFFTIFNFNWKICNSFNCNTIALAGLESQFFILTNNCNVFLFLVKLNLKNSHETALALDLFKFKSHRNGGIPDSM
jgi:hypothetical protein